MGEAARQFWPHPLHDPRARDVDPNDRVDGERESLTLTSPPTPTPTTRRRARASERFLAAWLNRHLGTAGAAGMIRQFGTRAILDALYDGIIVETTITRLRLDDTGHERHHYETVRTINPGLRSPGGFLREYLRSQQRQETP